METDRLFQELYRELRRIAAARMRRERRGHTLQTTALVSEAYLRLSKWDGASWKDRQHFLHTAARVMRHVLIDHARKRKSQLVLAAPDAEMTAGMPSHITYLELDEAIDALAVEHSRAAEALQYRYVLGIDVEDTAAALEVSEGTVRNDTRFALAWIRRRFSETGTR